MTRESCHYLNVCPPSGIASVLGPRLAAATDMLATTLEPPLVWFDPDTISNSRLADSLRFGVLEIHEHLETFFDRKDHAAEVRTTI